MQNSNAAVQVASGSSEDSTALQTIGTLSQRDPHKGRSSGITQREQPLKVDNGQGERLVRELAPYDNL